MTTNNRRILDDFSVSSVPGIIPGLTPFEVIRDLSTRQPSQLVSGSSLLISSIGVPSDLQLKPAMLPVIMGDQKRYFSPNDHAKIDMTFSLSITRRTSAPTGGHSAVRTTFSSFGVHSGCIKRLGFQVGSVEYRADITSVLPAGWNFRPSLSYDTIFASTTILAACNSSTRLTPRAPALAIVEAKDAKTRKTNKAIVVLKIITKNFPFLLSPKTWFKPIVFPGSLAVLKSRGEAAPNSRGVPRRRRRRNAFGLIQEYCTSSEIASQRKPPRFARRPVGIGFSGQKRIGDFERRKEKFFNH